MSSGSLLSVGVPGSRTVGDGEEEPRHPPPPPPPFFSAASPGETTAAGAARWEGWGQRLEPRRPGQPTAGAKGWVALWSHLPDPQPSPHPSLGGCRKSAHP